jgi:hypothetical protein
VRWTGVVLEVWPDGDLFTAELRCDDRTGPPLTAEMSMKECGVSVGEGDIFTIRDYVVSKVDLGTWTQAEIDDINRRAAIQAALLRGLSD